MKIKDIVKIIEKDGWILNRTRGAVIVCINIRQSAEWLRLPDTAAANFTRKPNVVF
jgi:hypothetical protein